jgi:hypothetical protein
MVSSFNGVRLNADFINYINHSMTLGLNLFPLNAFSTVLCNMPGTEELQRN